MNQKDQFLARLKSYVGYQEQENGWTRFGQAYADRHHSPSFAYADWCAMTIASVAREVGIPETVIPDYAACTHYLNWFEQTGLRTSATECAQPGDLVFYEWDGEKGALDGPDHIGVVESVNCEDPDRQILTVIEGNYQDQVARRVISYRDPRVWATCRPAYGTTAEETYRIDEGDTLTGDCSENRAESRYPCRIKRLGPARSCHRNRPGNFACQLGQRISGGAADQRL